MKHQELISPLDNRYNKKIVDLANNFSESNLNKTRFEIEIDWIIFLTSQCGKNFKTLSSAAKNNLLEIRKGFNNKSAKRIKTIESKTNHDVKAVELALSESFDGNEAIQSLIHIFLTSEDINSASYALMLKEMHLNTLDWIENLEAALGALIDENAELPMMARTHGQPATPTTLAKELNVYKQR